ncbi:unnamed protein product [Penicillium camemberti]|uniref:Str. FM013 n=1 Tax=Penicillium camemberti (strain FM 013) TaxID=1429867 RepID=A0A0G4PZD9_PENC3|nr:unnamed protein product [Penicillium camemberti]
MNGGVYEPLAVRIPRSYPITTVQFIITGGTLMFPLLESKRASALSARAPRYRCDPTLYHPDMTIGGIDDEPMPCADASTRYIREIPMAYTTVCLSAFEHGAEKCRCLVLHNDRGFLPSPLAMLLVQIRVQGEATNREDKAVYTEAQPSQLKSQKDRPILSHLVPRVAQAFDTYERVEMNQAEIYGATSSRSQKCLLGTGAWCIWIPSTHFSIKAQQLSRKSYMLWMSLKLQVTKLAARLCLLMSFSNLSRKQLLPGASSDSVHQRRHPFSIKYIFIIVQADPL